MPAGHHVAVLGRTTARRRRAALALLAAALCVPAGGCGSPETVGRATDASGSGDPSKACQSWPAPTGSPLRLDNDAGTAVLRMWQTNDATPPRDVPPDAVVYGDGLVLVVADGGDGMYRGTATGSQVAAVAARIWQLRGIDFHSSVNDGGALILEVVTRDGTARLTVEAPDDDADADAAAAGRCARPEARAIAETVLDLVGPNPQRWSPDAMWAGIRPVPSSSGAGAVPEWPLRRGLGSIGSPRPGYTDVRCAVLRGKDLAAVLAVAGEVRVDGRARRWRSDDALWDVTLLPVLPGETVCG
jgi:hypothetical protein